jgi:hypothetical protein
MRGYKVRVSRRRALMAGAAVGAGAVLAGCGATAETGREKAAATASAAAASAPEILSREAWGAAEPDHAARAEGGFYDAATNPAGWLTYGEPLWEALNTLVVHHSASAVDGVRDIQRLHMQTRGYADIGYHFLIGGDGLIYAGREAGARGAHTGGANTGTLGVALLGNFERGDLAAAQLDSLRQLGAYLAAAYGLTHLAGHRDFQPGATVCPGAGLAPLLPGMAAELGLAYGTGGYVAPA